MKKIFQIIILLILGQNIAFAEIAITNIRAKPSIGNLKSSAMYMDISNKSNDTDILISAKTEVSEICEIHKIVSNGDIHQMVKIDKLVIPANSDVALAPHNLHIMLINLKKPLIVGEKFPIVVSLEKAGDITVEAIVSEMNAKH